MNVLAISSLLFVSKTGSIQKSLRLRGGPHKDSQDSTGKINSQLTNDLNTISKYSAPIPYSGSSAKRESKDEIVEGVTRVIESVSTDVQDETNVEESLAVYVGRDYFRALTKALKTNQGHAMMGMPDLIVLDGSNGRWEEAGKMRDIISAAYEEGHKPRIVVAGITFRQEILDALFGSTVIWLSDNNALATQLGISVAGQSLTWRDTLKFLELHIKRDELMRLAA